MRRVAVRRGTGLWAAALAVYAFLYVPLAIVVAYSFNDSRLNAEWVGFTWHWYQVLLNDEDMLIAAGNSLFIALVSSLIATLLGTMAGIAMHRYNLRLLTFMVLPLYTNLEKHEPSLLDAAQDLGANAWQRFWRVTFPLSLPGVFSGSALVFIPVLGMFAVPDILGGTGDMLIGNLIKEQFLGTRDWPFGSTLSIMLTIAVLLIAQLAVKLGGRGGRYA